MAEQDPSGINVELRAILHDAIRERCWLTAIFFFVCHDKLRRAAIDAERKSAPKLSPFLYQLR